MVHDARIATTGEQDRGHPGVTARSQRPGADRRSRAGFWIVGLAFLAVMSMSALPAPLYVAYQARDGFSDATLAAIYSAYALGVIASLFFVGHVSDWYGRRRVLVPAVALSAVSAAIFLVWSELPGLFVARVVGGLSVGAVTATATAWIAELHTASRPDTGTRRPQLVAAVANVGGLGLGPLVSGILAETAGDPLVLPYVVALVALVLATAFLAAVPETRTADRDRTVYRPQRVSVPSSARGRYAAAALGTLISFAALGLFSGLAGTLLADTFDTPSRAVAGVTIFVVFGSGVAGQILTTDWSLEAVLRVSMGTLVAGLALIVLSVWLPDPSLVVFLVGGAVAGAGGGALFKGTLGVVVEISEPQRRAEALAGLFLAGYVGLSAPIAGLGVALEVVDPRTTLLGFGALAAAGIAAAAPTLARAARPA